MFGLRRLSAAGAWGGRPGRAGTRGWAASLRARRGGAGSPRARLGAPRSAVHSHRSPGRGRRQSLASTARTGSETPRAGPLPPPLRRPRPAAGCGRRGRSRGPAATTAPADCGRGAAAPPGVRRALQSALPPRVEGGRTAAAPPAPGCAARPKEGLGPVSRPGGTARGSAGYRPGREGPRPERLPARGGRGGPGGGRPAGRRKGSGERGGRRRVGRPRPRREGKAGRRSAVPLSRAQGSSGGWGGTRGAGAAALTRACRALCCWDAAAEGKQKQSAFGSKGKQTRLCSVSTSVPLETVGCSAFISKFIFTSYLRESVSAGTLAKSA